MAGKERIISSEIVKDFTWEFHLLEYSFCSSLLRCELTPLEKRRMGVSRKYDWLHKALKSAILNKYTQSDFNQRDDAVKDVLGQLQYEIIIVRQCGDD